MLGRERLSAFLLALVLSVAACGQSPHQRDTRALGDRAITIASFNFPESVILGEIYALALEANGYEVERRLDLGPRELLQPALERGLIEFVPEYLGSALGFLAGSQAVSKSLPAARRRLAAELSPRGIRVLASSSAEDANGIAVTTATSREYGLTKISDLAPVARQLVFGGPPECPQRPLCLPGLEERYGLVFKRFVPLDESGPITAAALSSGQVDVALMFTTDPNLATGDLLLLEDDRRLQPPENVTPLLREEVVQAHGPGLVRLVDSLSRRLTTEGLTELNRLVSLEGMTPRAAAREWLRRHAPAA